MEVELKHIYKEYKNNVVFNDFCFTAEEGKITVILGESGQGKTTLLNIIADLTEYKGEVVKPKDVSYVFQKDRLIKNLTVEQNLKITDSSIDVENALKSVNLLEKKDAYPFSLSGGMSRRIAIVRAIYNKAKLVLMDEPFIKLDLALKFKLMDLIKNIQKKENKTIVAVTHDIKEAVYFANRIVVLNNGKIVKDVNNITSDTEKELFDFLLNLNKIKNE